MPRGQTAWNKEVAKHYKKNKKKKGYMLKDAMKDAKNTYKKTSKN